MRPPSASQREKASRYMWQGRVRVYAAGPHGCAATVRGTEEYTVTLECGEWRCTCPAQDYHPGSACAHIAAIYMWWTIRYGHKEEGETDGD